ncbi:unnamed protein product, partial [Laminaria digitata]
QPDWVSAVAGVGEGLESFVTGCYDGCLRVYGPGCKVTSLEKAHKSPVTALCAVLPGGAGGAKGFLSGSKDMTARLWRRVGSGSNASLEAAAVLTGHTNSVSAVHATCSAAFTGDWDGHVCMWDVACLAADNTADRGGSKRRKTDKAEAAAAVSEQLPTAGFRAHAQAVTGLAGPAGVGAGGGGGGGGGEGAATLYSASLDRAVKTWDAERQDCVHTLNAPKAVTCLGCSDSGR